VGWIWRRPWLARLLLTPAVRRRIAPGLRALICGSAPLAEETQRFFMMLKLPVLQVYGLTETTAICTMDRPGRVVPGRVGAAVDGCEMRLDEHGEIHVRGPNVFPGYWGREPQGEWLATGDLGEVDAQGNWRILGRAKHVIVLASGHNVPPEPIEERLRLLIPGATHVMLAGHGRKALVALVAGRAERTAADREVAALNDELPHYRRVRGVHLCPPFTPDEGLLTANGKLRRDAILQRYRAEIEGLYL
jgi:long-chain acyl-CoA synthetase